MKDLLYLSRHARYHFYAVSRLQLHSKKLHPDQGVAHAIKCRLCTGGMRVPIPVHQWYQYERMKMQLVGSSWRLKATWADPSPCSMSGIHVNELMQCQRKISSAKGLLFTDLMP